MAPARGERPSTVTHLGHVPEECAHQKVDDPAEPDRHLDAEIMETSDGAAEHVLNLIYGVNVRVTETVWGEFAALGSLTVSDPV